MYVHMHAGICIYLRTHNLVLKQTVTMTIINITTILVPTESRAMVPSETTIVATVSVRMYSKIKNRRHKDVQNI